jgi:hypothetical protein
MKNLLLLSIITLAFSGCTATWHGVKEDSTSATDWTKQKVNEGAGYVQEKTK